MRIGAQEIGRTYDCAFPYCDGETRELGGRCESHVDSEWTRAPTALPAETPENQPPGPTTALTIEWRHNMDGAEVRKLSRALARDLSLTAEVFTAHILTAGTVPDPEPELEPAPPAVVITTDPPAYSRLHHLGQLGERAEVLLHELQEAWEEIARCQIALEPLLTRIRWISNQELMNECINGEDLADELEREKARLKAKWKKDA